MGKVKRYSDIPWYDKVLEADDEDLFKSRDPRTLVIENIFEDYQFADDHIELALEGFRFDDLMRWEAGKLLEKEPEGLYFPDLGKYDLTGDGIEDIILISNSESIPGEKEKNELGRDLIYYRTGLQNSDASIYLTGGSSGTMVTDPERGTFVDPKYYYRPIPESHVVVNPNLEQIFGW